MSTISIPSAEGQPSRTKRNHAAAIAVVLAASLAAVGSAVPAAAQETKPNILFIMGDDIGWMQPSIYHEGLAVGETPNIDRIGHEGAKFMTYYAEQSCTAGRTAFITGMQPVRVGMVLPEIRAAPLICGRARRRSQGSCSISATRQASSAKTISEIPPSPSPRRTGSRNIGATCITSMPCSR